MLSVNVETRTHVIVNLGFLNLVAAILASEEMVTHKRLIRLVCECLWNCSLEDAAREEMAARGTLIDLMTVIRRRHVRTQPILEQCLGVLRNFSIRSDAKMHLCDMGEAWGGGVGGEAPDPVVAAVGRRGGGNVFFPFLKFVLKVRHTV